MYATSSKVWHTFLQQSILILVNYEKAISNFFMLLSIASLAQKPANGTYLLKFFDLEYGKFHGICKVIVIDDSVAVYAVKDCHRKKGQLINTGLIKLEGDGKYLIFHRKKEDENNSNYEEIPDRISFKKKIFYTY